MKQVIQLLVLSLFSLTALMAQNRTFPEFPEDTSPGSTDLVLTWDGVKNTKVQLSNLNEGLSISAGDFDNSAAGDGLGIGISGELIVNVDGVYIEISSDNVSLIAHSIDSAAIQLAGIYLKNLSTEVVDLIKSGLATNGTDTVEVIFDGTSNRINSNERLYLGVDNDSSMYVDNNIVFLPEETDMYYGVGGRIGQNSDGTVEYVSIGSNNLLFKFGVDTNFILQPGVTDFIDSVSFPQSFWTEINDSVGGGGTGSSSNTEILFNNSGTVDGNSSHTIVGPVMSVGLLTASSGITTTGGTSIVADGFVAGDSVGVYDGGGGDPFSGLIKDANGNGYLQIGGTSADSTGRIYANTWNDVANVSSSSNLVFRNNAELYIDSLITVSNGVDSTIIIQEGTNINIEPIGQVYLSPGETDAWYFSSSSFYSGAGSGTGIIVNNETASSTNPIIHSRNSNNTGISIDNTATYIIDGGVLKLAVYTDSIVNYDEVRLKNYTNEENEYQVYLNPNTGEITAAELSHGFYSFEDETETITISTINVWEQVTNATNDLYTDVESEHMSISGDTIEINTTGHYKFTVNNIVDGGNNVNYEIRVFNVTDAAGVPVKGAITTRGSSFDPLNCFSYDVNATANDRYVIQIRNTSGTANLDMIDGSIYVEITHAE